MDWTPFRMDGSRSRQEILELRKTVFSQENPEKQHPAYWDWEFANAFFGRAEIYTVRHDSRLVGHYAFLPQRYRIHGNSRTAGLAVDAMVHPLQRRKGMFGVLQEYALNHTDFAFAIGYTIRKEVLPAELKGGYQIVQQAPVFVFPVRFDAILRRYLKFTFPADAAGAIAGWVHRTCFPESPDGGGLVIQPVESLADALGDFFGRQTKSCDIVLEKSAEYIRWRFDQIFGVSYEKYVLQKENSMVAGYLVLRRENLFGLDTLAVVDMETVDGTEALTDGLIRFVVSRARQRNCDCAAVMLLDDGRITRRLKKQGFLKSPYAFHLIVHNCGKEDTAAWFRKSKSICLNWSDTDML